ncbi:MAG: hypothetical protein WHS65_14165 [Melioribacteraceae bacterium]
MKFVKTEVINLKSSTEYNEKWVQQRIIEDPSILGLGDVIVKDSERIQPSGGRLDILLQDPESNRRYEVELQLGKSDESHIIRTIEYWDIERKRYPQYDHCAVIIAEDITSRFLNVISLFNGYIPIIAIQVKALKIEGNISLFFTTVLDVINLGTEEEAEKEITDRKYWENLSSKNTLELVDSIINLIQDIIPGFQLKYNKYYIGLNKDGISKNFISFTPRRTSIILNIKYENNQEFDELLKATDIDILSYDKQWNQYRLRLNENDIKKNKELLIKLIEKAYKRYMNLD